MNVSIDMKKLVPAWNDFRTQTGIEPISDENHYQQMTELLFVLLDQTGTDERHPLMGLVDIVGDLIHDYETVHYPLPETSGVDALRFFMARDGLKQGDLPEIGSQGVVSEILSGDRDLNVRQIKALAERFSVAPAIFL